MNDYSTDIDTNRELLRREDFADAVHSQNASNVSGLIMSLSAVLPRIRASIRAGNVPDKCTHPGNHPIVQLYTYQIAYLVKLTSGGEEPAGWNWTEVYRYCEERSRKEKEDV